MNKYLFVLILVYISCHTSISCQNERLLDSVNKYYWLSQNDKYSNKERLKDAIKAKSFSDKLSNDSITLSVQRKLAYAYFINEMYDKYIPINKENLKLAYRLKDTLAIQYATTNLGSVYRFEQQNDSAYYYYTKAIEYFKPQNKSFLKAQSFLALADIQQEEKAYIGAEEDAITSLRIVTQLKKTEDTYYIQWSLYNLLAIIANRTGDLEKSVEFHDKAIELSKEMDGGYGYEIYSLSNKANAFKEFGEYDKALSIINSLISQKERYNADEPDFYPTLLLTLVETKFASGNYTFKENENYLKEAYNLFLGIDDKVGVMATANEFSVLYAKHNQIDLAKKYGNEAIKIADEISNNEYKLKAIKTLSDLYEGDASKALYKQYINLSDSLQNADNMNRNKFARVKFDTEELEAKNEQISKENFYLLLLLAGLILTAIAIYVVISQRAKNQEILLLQEQQSANEHIYNLMLGQQDKVDEARTQEKIRVSKELHDGVLGELFGVRLSLDSLNFSDGKEAMKNRAGYINKLKTIENDIREISHKMNADFVSGSGFMDIVSELIENQTKAYGFTYTFNYSDDIIWEALPNKTKINIYRILQESFQNIYKHAEAEHVVVNINKENNKINIYIKDDGKGFEISKSKKGIGLKNMTSRVKEVKGEIDWNSKIGNGTTVHVKIPYLI